MKLSIEHFNNVSKEDIINGSSLYMDFPCIYFLIQDDQIVYIGQSVSVGERLASHSKNKKFNRVSLMPCPKDQLNNFEAALIVKFNPPYNQSLPNNDLYISLHVLKKLTGLNKWKLKKFCKKNQLNPVYGTQYLRRDFDDLLNEAYS